MGTKIWNALPRFCLVIRAPDRSDRPARPSDPTPAFVDSRFSGYPGIWIFRDMGYSGIPYIFHILVMWNGSLNSTKGVSEKMRIRDLWGMLMDG